MWAEEIVSIIFQMLFCSYLCIPLPAMPARHQPLAAVLLDVLLRVASLDLGSALVLAVDGLVPTIALVLLKFK